MRSTNRRKKQSEIIVDLSNRADRGTRAAAGGFLLDRNRRTQPIDGIDIGALHLIQEWPSVSGKCLHVSPLTFRVDGVKGQRRLPGTAKSSDHRKCISRNLNVYVLEIVLARPAHRNLSNSHVGQR